MRDIIVHYLVETAKENLYDIALRMADEQGISFRGVDPKAYEILGTTPEELKKYEVKVKQVEVVEDLGGRQRGIVVLEYPVENAVGQGKPSFSQLLAYIAGDLMESVYAKELKILHVELPEELERMFGGPKRADRLRERRVEGPYLALIVKPSLGLSPEQVAKLAREVSKAGIHMIADDEKMAETSYNSRIRRIERVLSALDKRSRTIYFVNASGSPKQIKELVKKALEIPRAEERLGILIPSTYAGYDSINEVREELDVPIYTRNSGSGSIAEGKKSLSWPVIAYLERLAGSDIAQIPPPIGVHKKSKDIVMLAYRALTDKRSVMSSIPLIGAGIHPCRVHKALSMGFLDVVYLVGRAIVGHPMGPAAGVKAMLQAFEGFKKGYTVAELIEKYKEFAKACEKRGIDRV